VQAGGAFVCGSHDLLRALFALQLDDDVVAISLCKQIQSPCSGAEPLYKMQPLLDLV